MAHLPIGKRMAIGTQGTVVLIEKHGLGQIMLAPQHALFVVEATNCFQKTP